MAERLALPTSVHGVAGSNPAGGEILPEPKRSFTAQSRSCSSFHCLEVTEILLKGRKTLTHPSVSPCLRLIQIRGQLFLSVVSGTLKVIIPPVKKPRRKVYLYQKGDYVSGSGSG